MFRSSVWSRVAIFSLVFALLISVPTGFAQNAVEATVPDQTEDGEKTSGLKVGSNQLETDKEELPVIGAQLITATTYAYSFQNGVALEDMSTGTTALVGGGADDTASAVTNIGFDFWYDGTAYSQFSINVNGLARLGSTAIGTTFNNSTDGLGSVTNAPKIAPYFEDLCTGSTGGVRYKIVGTAPNRKLVVEWFGMEVPREGSCSVLPQTGVFQMWLFESAGSTTPGQIQFVYGGGMSPSTVTDLGASVGLQSGAATNFASVTLADDTVSYVTANNTNLGGIAAGKSYLFTYAQPANATALNFTAVTQSSMTLNWTDNSTGESGFAVQRSTDGINYTLVTTTAADAVSFNDTGLIPGQNYFYRVFAAPQGPSSVPASGSQATNVAGNDTCAGVGGNWSSTTTWTDGSVPTSTDNVTIGSGCTVEIDTAAAVAFNVTIDSGGTLQSPAAGAVLTNNLSVGGNVTNNGTLDLSNNGETSAATLSFVAPAPNVTFGGTGATTDVRAITVNKSSLSNTVELNPTNFSVQGVVTDVAGFLTLTNGTFKISGTFNGLNRIFTTAGYTIPATGGIWLNNPNFTVAGQNGSPTNSGLFRLTSGVYNVGTSSGNSLGGGTGSVFTIEGGLLNVAGRLQTTSTITYNQSGGDVNVCTVGNTATTACFGLTSTTNTFNMSGGNITLVTPSGNATPLDYSVSTSATVVFVTNPVTTVLNVGTGAAAQNFRVSGSTPSLNIPANKTMNVGSGAAGGAIFHRGATIVNNGIITVQGTGASSRFDFAASGPMTYSGAGIFGTAAVPFGGVGISANSPTGNNTTISSPIFVNRTNFFSGGFVGSGNITFGDGLASASVIQTGNSTTPTNAGTFDVSPNFNIGSGGHILLYLRTTTLNRVTGFEIPPSRTVLTFTHDDNAVGGTLGLSGGNLTVTGVMTLTNGVTLTGASKIVNNGTAIRTNGFIDGNLERSYAAVGAYTYHVGQTAYSPVVANVTALGTNPSSLMARAVDTPMIGLETAKSLSRNWNLTETGDLTADVSFTYAADAADVNGIETDYRVYKSVGGVITNMCAGAPCVNDATNTLGPLVGVTDFNAAWSGGENSIIDTNTPDTTILTNPVNPINSSAATFTFSGTDSLVGIAGFECSIDAGPFATCTSPRTYTGLADGSHTFQVRAVDTAGNRDLTPASYTWVIDTVVPDTTILTNPTNPTTNTSAAFTFNASGLGISYTFQCKLDAGMFTPCTSPQSYVGLAVGSHTFEVRAADLAGNVDLTPASYTWMINAPATNVTVTATAGTPGPTNYATLKDAIDAINGGTHQGAITVAINSNTTETAPSVLNGSGAGSAVYTSVLIRPSADGVTVAGPTATGRGLIELNGADNVTIDGDNPGSMGTNRNLTIQNTAANTVTFTSVIRVALNITTVASADNNIFRNLNIVGSSSGRNIAAANTTGGSENTTFGIFLGPNASGAATAPTAISSVSTGVAAGATATNLIVQNNSVSTAARAVSINGSATTVAPGLQILGNAIGNPTAGNADQVTAIGITANGSANAVISGNLVWVEGFVRSSAATHGINVGVNSANTTGAIIEKNDVRRVKNNDLQTWTAMGINLGGGNNHIVRNNFVSNVINDQVGGTGSFGALFGAYGMRVGSGTGHQILHNSVNMSGAINGVLGTNSTAAFLSSATTQTGMDVRNNIFVNTISGGLPSGTRNVAVMLPSGGTSAMNLTLNNNGYFVGADAQNRLAQVGTTLGTGEFTLANFDPTMTTPATNFRSYTSTLSAAGTNDIASLKVDPLFVSNTDLHLQAASPMLELGANAGVTDDIDGDARDSVPDIGADELAAVAVPGVLAFSSATYNVAENMMGGTVTITVNRTGGTDGTVGATYALTNGSATGGASCGAGVDFVNTGGTVSLLNGEASKTFTVAICDDAVFEGDETFNVGLSAPTGGATIGMPSSAVVTINDNEVAVPGTLQFSAATYTVGEAGPTVTITVTRTGGSDGAVGASYATVVGGTATGGAACGGAIDYVNTNGTVSFGNGVTTPQTFTIPICDDSTVESTETVNLALTSPTGGATLGSPNTSVLSITDNDVAPGGAFSVNDVRVTEGNAATVTATFTVTYTAGGAANINFATANQTATSGSDYVTNSGTLNFPTSASTQTQTVNVTVNGDILKEANETFQFNLSGATGGATIADNRGYGVIRDEDRSYFADFDDDLKADYSVHRQSEQRHYVLRSSNGTNLITTFGLATDVATPGDYDGDGRTDIALYRPSTSTFYAINSSTNTVKGITVGSAGDTPVQGDYNGDGRTDLATFRPSTGLWSILFINDGSSAVVSFGLTGDLPVQADYDGDAKTDIAIYRAGTWYVLRSSDSSVSITNWGLATDKPVSGDFDGDGRFDLAVYRGAGQWWILNSLNGNSAVIAFGLATDVTASADYDGDGTTDVAVYRPSAGDWYVLQSSNNSITGVKWGIATDSPIPNRYFAQ